MRSHSIVSLAIVLAAVGAARPALADEAEALAQGIALFENFDDEHAALALRALLARKPGRVTAAKAHLYLGLIEFNANAPDAADTEFKLALRANPAIELPPGTSPKTRWLWSEARNEFTREIDRPQAAAPSPPAAALRPATTASVEEAPAPSHPRPAAIALGVAGILLGATAVYGGVQVLDYQGTINQATVAPGTVSGSQALSARGAAQFWAAAWIPLAVAGAGCLVGAAFTW